VTALIANSSGIYMVEEYRTVQALDRFHAGGSAANSPSARCTAVYDRRTFSARHSRLGVEAAAEFDEALPRLLRIRWRCGVALTPTLSQFWERGDII